MKKTAKAAVYTGPGRPFEIREYPLTPPPRGMADAGINCQRNLRDGSAYS